MRLAVVALCAAVLGGCDESPTSPSSGPIVVRGSIDRPTIGASDVAMLSYRAENVSNATVTLTFPSSCFVSVTFVNTATGLSVPAPIACLTIITTRTLQPGEALTSTFRIRSTATADAFAIALAAGHYRAIGVLDTSPRVEAAPVQFTVN